MSWIRGLLAFAVVSAIASLVTRGGTTRSEKPKQMKEEIDPGIVGIPSCAARIECNHDFVGWREFADGRGGERVCRHCGMGAMEWSVRTGL